MYSAPGAELEHLLPRLTHDVKGIFGDDLIGLYLHGSLVTGDFNQDRSDLDLLAVLRADVDEKDLERLRTMHARLVEDYLPWHDRIEVEYVSAAALSTFRTQPRLMARISPGEPLHLLEATRHYLLNWYTARQGVALFGPPPQEVIPDISQAEFVAGVLEHARSWGEWVADMRHPGGQAYAVLTLCRALYTCTHGTQVSKKGAARAVKPLLPQWSGLIEWALSWWYEGGTQTEQDRLPEVMRFVEEVNRVLTVAREERSR